jgi:hypothetical protein
MCHAAARPDFDGATARVPRLAVSSEAEPEAEGPNPDPAATESFLTPHKLRFTTSDPAMRAAMWRLWAARPAAVPFGELVAAAPTGATADDLAGGLLQLYLGDIVMLHLHPPALAATAGPRPTASPVARLQAARGAESIHDLRHRSSKPDPFARYLLPLLDGTRDLAHLVDVLAERSAAGEFEVRDGSGQAAKEPGLVRQVLAAWLDAALERLARAGLLMG